MPHGFSAVQQEVSYADHVAGSQAGLPESKPLTFDEIRIQDKIINDSKSDR